MSVQYSPIPSIPPSVMPTLAEATSSPPIAPPKYQLSDDELLIRDKLGNITKKRFYFDEKGDDKDRIEDEDRLDEYEENLKQLYGDRFQVLIPLGFSETKFAQLVMERATEKIYVLAIAELLVTTTSDKEFSILDQARRQNHQYRTFIREIEILKLLKNKPGIVQLYEDKKLEIKDNRGTWQIVSLLEELGEFDLFDYFEGKFETITSVIRSPENNILIVLSILEALKSLEECGVVHGDIKPEHFLISVLKKAIKVFLIDFNYSRLIKAEKEKDKHLEKTIFINKCTLFYPPEYITKKEDSHKLDVYSTGMVLYWILNGSAALPRLFYDADDAHDPVLALKAINDPKWFPNLPLDNGLLKHKPIAELIHKMLQRNPNDRPTGTEAFAMAQQIYSANEPKIKID